MGGILHSRVFKVCVVGRDTSWETLVVMSLMTTSTYRYYQTPSLTSIDSFAYRASRDDPRLPSSSARHRPSTPFYF